MQRAAIQVARRVFDLDDNERFISDMRESQEYGRQPETWEALFEDLWAAERTEPRSAVLARAMTIAGVARDELPTLAVAALGEYQGRPDLLIAAADGLLPRLIAADFETRPEVLRLKFLLSEIEDDVGHRDAYIRDLLEFVRSCTERADPQSRIQG